MYSSQNLSVNISHIRGLRDLKQLIQVNCSFTSTFNNDYHYELPISALKKTAKQQQKTNYTEFSPYAKTIDNGNHKTIMTMILIIIIIIIIIITILMTEN